MFQLYSTYTLRIVNDGIERGRLAKSACAPFGETPMPLNVECDISLKPLGVCVRVCITACSPVENVANGDTGSAATRFAGSLSAHVAGHESTYVCRDVETREIPPAGGDLALFSRLGVVRAMSWTPRFASGSVRNSGFFLGGAARVDLRAGIPRLLQVMMIYKQTERT